LINATSFSFLISLDYSLNKMSIILGIWPSAWALPDRPVETSSTLIGWAMTHARMTALLRHTWLSTLPCGFMILCRSVVPRITVGKRRSAWALRPPLDCIIPIGLATMRGAWLMEMNLSTVSTLLRCFFVIADPSNAKLTSNLLFYFSSGFQSVLMAVQLLVGVLRNTLPLQSVGMHPGCSLSRNWQILHALD
jgi:hypothetical protein